MFKPCWHHEGGCHARVTPVTQHFHQCRCELYAVRLLLRIADIMLLSLASGLEETVPHGFGNSRTRIAEVVQSPCGETVGEACVMSRSNGLHGTNYRQFLNASCPCALNDHLYIEIRNYITRRGKHLLCDFFRHFEYFRDNIAALSMRRAYAIELGDGRH